MGYGDEQVHPGYLLLAGLGCAVVFYRLYLWVREAQVKPDPWEPEIEAGLQESDAFPACLKCSAPQPPGQWFCGHCGTAVGPYNNLMPYVNAFSEGEVLRNGVNARLRLSPLTICGYVFLSVAYLNLAPIGVVLLVICSPLLLIGVPLEGLIVLGGVAAPAVYFVRVLRNLLCQRGATPSSADADAAPTTPA